MVSELETPIYIVQGFSSKPCLTTPDESLLVTIIDRGALLAIIHIHV